MLFIVVIVIGAMFSFLGSLLLMLSLSATTFSKQLAPLKPLGLLLAVLGFGILYWGMTHHHELLANE